MGSGVETAVFGVQWGACPLPEPPDLVVVEGKANTIQLGGQKAGVWVKMAKTGPLLVLDSLAVGCRFEPAVGGTSEALRLLSYP